MADDDQNEGYRHCMANCSGCLSDRCCWDLASGDGACDCSPFDGDGQLPLPSVLLGVPEEVE